MAENESFKNRFSETAEKIIRDSEKIASMMDAGLGTEHLLVALASNPGTVAYETLRELMVTPERITFILQSLMPHLAAKRGITQDLKTALKGAYQKAAYYGTPSIDSEHLLLALVTNKDSNGYRVLDRLGADPRLLRHQIEQYLESVTGSHLPYESPEPEQPPELPDNLIPHYPSEIPRQSNRTKTAIDYFCGDLTKQAKANKLDPVIGRNSEIRRITQILIRRIKNNPVLTGEPGVGKTAIVEGLAQRIISGDIPSQLADKRILSLDLALLISGTTYRGQFEERTKKLIDEIIKAGNIILFLDEIHAMVGAGAAEGSMDLSHILKPALAKGHLRLIGATTNDEYRKYIEKDPALERRLQRVQVEEPSSEESVAILQGLRPAYEGHHNVKISDEAIIAAVEFSKRYINDRFLPDKAIDLVDEAAAATQLEPKKLKLNNKISEQEARRRQANLEHQKAAENFDYEKSARYRVLELRLIEEIRKIKRELPKKSSPPSINREEIAKVVSQWTGVPVSTMTKTDKIRLINLEEILTGRIIGQEEAVAAIAKAIRRCAAGVGDPNRPLGSFIFLGPTGVGKTELAKTLAAQVYGREKALIKLDMSEFMERHNVSRLVGAPPGYVGYDEAGKLTEMVRRAPYSVLLLDEIEKAHPDVFNMLLQIMEDGHLTDAKGRRVNFRNTIIIMTSNIGSAELNRTQAIGFKTSESDSLKEFDQLKNQITDRLKDHFRPEFLNRLDEIIVFKPLGKNEVKKVVELEIGKMTARLSLEGQALPRGIELKVEESAKEFIAEKGFDPTFGARPIRRAITKYIENPLSDLLLSGKFAAGTPIRVLRKGEKLVFVK